MECSNKRTEDDRCRHLLQAQQRSVNDWAQVIKSKELMHRELIMLIWPFYRMVSAYNVSGRCTWRNIRRQSPFLHLGKFCAQKGKVRREGLKAYLTNLSVSRTQILLSNHAWRFGPYTVFLTELVPGLCSENAGPEKPLPSQSQLHRDI